ncbi:hypothetical protein NQ318_015294 [Aromia moschata]|uniref:HAT C-terminal dimerisation domain-containing protein n=1 Tax=Aromia moschata TaxID=1265417 RepID=A0AAV8XCS4_9CUCU|nr:hypothetical protein NQ318_015294 [Aromia moschata]
MLKHGLDMDEINQITQKNVADIENINSSADEKSNKGPDTESDSLWDHFDKKLAQVKNTITPTSNVIMAVRHYLELPHVARNSNPLDFWEKHRFTLLELYKLHLKYLGCLASSVPSERIFSKSGQLTNTRRNRLHSKNLDKIIFLNSVHSASHNDAAQLFSLRVASTSCAPTWQGTHVKTISNDTIKEVSVGAYTHSRVPLVFIPYCAPTLSYCTNVRNYWAMAFWRPFETTVRDDLSRESKNLMPQSNELAINDTDDRAEFKNKDLHVQC